MIAFVSLSSRIDQFYSTAYLSRCVPLVVSMVKVSLPFQKLSGLPQLSKIGLLSEKTLELRVMQDEGMTVAVW